MKSVAGSRANSARVMSSSVCSVRGCGGNVHRGTGADADEEERWVGADIAMFVEMPPVAASGLAPASSSVARRLRSVFVLPTRRAGHDAPLAASSDEAALHAANLGASARSHCIVHRCLITASRTSGETRQSPVCSATYLLCRCSSRNMTEPGQCPASSAFIRTPSTSMLSPTSTVTITLGFTPSVARSTRAVMDEQ
eukprot:scaffold172907_cov30-Tisochrysis_lutea.AAC.3